MQQFLAGTRKTMYALLGWSVLLLGLVMIPYPGPGLVVTFVGLSILAREFYWARRVYDVGHMKYRDWLSWITRQSLFVRLAFGALSVLTVVVTLWLLNGYGFMNTLLGLHHDWLNSPFIG